jgi:3-oxoacyl-[acyl-carrier-protein] synthase-3
MTPTRPLQECLLDRLRQVQEALGAEPSADPGVRFADVVDSMGLVEFVALVAEDLGVPPQAVEEAAEWRFGTVAELATALLKVGLVPRLPGARAAAEDPSPRRERAGAAVWLAATAARLPSRCQPATALDAALGRPPGWLGAHAGLHSRHVWDGDDPLDAAARAAADCLEHAAVALSDVAALLVTSEAPPKPAGLAAALHHRLGLAPGVVALDVGGACTGFLAALWLARRLVTLGAAVLVVAVEAPSLWLATEPGPAGEAASLFGDGAAACVLGGSPVGPAPLSLLDVRLETDGAAGDLLRVLHAPGTSLQLDMRGPALALWAVQTMARLVSEMALAAGTTPQRLGAVVMHAGNGRMPDVLARRLGLPRARVWGETGRTGNLGSASVPVAWAAGQERRGGYADGLVAWVAAGAGLMAGAALWEPTGAGRKGTMKAFALTLTGLLAGVVAFADEPGPLPPVEARKAVGRRITVEMVVRAAKDRLEKRGEIYLDSEENFRDPRNFAVVITRKGAARFKETGVTDPANHFRGKRIRATGTVKEVQNIPRIEVDDPARLRRVDRDR